MKRKGRRLEQVLAPETVSAAETLLQQLKEDEERDASLEESLLRLQSALSASSEMALAIVTAMGRVPTERMAKLLQSLLGSLPDKQVQRGIRRSLYRIEQQGVTIQAGPGKAPATSVLRPPVEDVPRGFISSVDADGSQVVLLTIPRKPKGLYLLQGIVNDTRGLVEFSRVETTRKGFREFHQSIRERGQLTVVGVDPGYCRFRLEEAVDAMEQRGKSLPPDYVTSKRDLQKLEPVQTPPVSRFLNEEEIANNPRLRSSSSDLFQIEPFSSWFLPREEVQQYVDLVEEAEESRLVLNPAQKEARLQETYRKALVELFSEEKREVFRRRLEEMAYVLLEAGQEERAKVALAASLDLRFDLNLLEPNPFLLGLVTRSIYTTVAQDREKKEAEPSLIVKP